MLIENIGEDWSAGVLLTANEGWQCRQGAVLVSTAGSGSNDRGIRLESGQAWPFPEGATVYYRRVSGPGATIAREPVA
jgi:hypothetical protein